ncbi:hypothetical protein BDM02DRAFT_2743043 [Thelephora ganbajun]|uniref:Uncharacterized protein n=1 Tax=Thelephora ganbajun TaxID=370292 RepID=A0ACB6ZCE7_THEGA|nr:hypothetical protein BDM02DRAFT_2743043 [Thelephora ganbajun]
MVNPGDPQRLTSEKYCPPYTDVREWIHSIESLYNLYEISDIQKLQCAMEFVKEELSIELRRVLIEIGKSLGPVHWVQFKSFLVAFDPLPFYKKHPKRTAAVSIVGDIVLTPIATTALSHVEGLKFCRSR